MAGRATAPERATVLDARGQKRDSDRLELRIGRRRHEKFRTYVADPERPGRKVASPWGTYEQAVEWRGKALGIRQGPSVLLASGRAQATLDRRERCSLNLSRG